MKLTPLIPDIKKKTSKLLFFSILLSLHAKADIATYNWQRELKGFSIEAIPGTSEYVAVGTINYNTTINGYYIAEGIHFMHLDNTGNIICDKTINAPTPPDQYMSFQAVDVAVENDNSFWITMQFRGIDPVQPSFDKDIITIANIDYNCNFIYTAGRIHTVDGIESTDPYYQNLIPTHSVFSDGHLFISGYATPASESYPLIPTRAMSDKLGFVIKIDVNGGAFGPVIVNSIEWDSPNTPSASYDYDMPIKMKLYGSNFPPNIFVTGAANSNVDDQSNILLFELTNSLGVQAHNTLHFSYMSGNSLPSGPVGADIISGIGNNEYYVLANNMVDNDYQAWSVTRVNQMNLIVFNPLLPSSLFSTNLSGGNYKVSGMLEDGTVYGEQSELQCYSAIASPHLNPSNLNFNPFLDFATYSYNSSTGISKTTSTHKVQLSRNGTDLFYSGSGHFHDNFHRIFTGYFLDASGAGYKIMSPVLNNSNNFQNSKFISTDGNGEENDCNSTHTDCSGNFTYAYATNNAPVIDFTPSLSYSTMLAIDLVEEAIITTENVCSGGQYKKSNEKNKNTTINSTVTPNSVKKYIKSRPNSIAGNNNISLYPNPAKDLAFLTLGLDKSTNVSVHIVDAVGRINNVIDNQNYKEGAYKIQLNVEDLPAGIYMVKVQVDNNSSTHQLTVIR